MTGEHLADTVAQLAEVIVQTLDLFCPGAPVEIRVLTDQKVMQIHRFADHRAAAQWATRFPTARGFYFGMNPFDPQAINGQAVTDAAVTRRRLILVDADPVRATDTNSTDDELAAAHEVAANVRDYLTAVDWPEPVECDSGNGAHLLYAVDLPNDEKMLAAVSGVLKYLSRTFSTSAVHIDTKVANASRITKLYGTMTRKGPATPERPHRASRITHIPSPFEQVSIFHFQKIARLGADDSVKADTPIAAETKQSVERIARIEMARSWLSVQRPAIQGQHGDAHTHHICCAIAVGHDLSAEDAFDVLGQWNQSCKPPWEAHDLRYKIQNAIRNAKEPRGARLLQFPLTEVGDAECFASLYQDVVRHDHLRGRWLIADETSGIWVPDPIEQLTPMTTRMMRMRHYQALALDDPKAIRWAVTGESRKRLANTIALARSESPIADDGLNWDQNPLLLGVQNGVVDLRTAQWRKAAAADRVTMRVRVAYDASATCPLWLATLSSTFAPCDLFGADESQRIIDFVQRAIGYSITGDCREECCFFTWGGGSNGKGTIMNTLGWLLGDYHDEMPRATLEQSIHGRGIPNDVAKLVGKRFVTCAEVNEFTIDEPRLKSLTGRDPITARFLHREFFTFIATFKIWIATNNKPKIVGTDDGIWRRIHLIPSQQSFKGRENKELKDQLLQELPGILNWCIDGSVKWLEKGLHPPKTVKTATEEYRNESNPIMPFVESCCVIGDGVRMQAALAFKAYEMWFKSCGEPPWKKLSDKAFHAAMRQTFKFEEGRQTFYLGVGLMVRDREPGEEG